jgi:transcription antitermination protein NusB
MLNARRAARDLALKVLFQVDVGKQPLTEVMQGALEQVQQVVDHPVSQLQHELQADLRARVEALRPEMSTQSLRHVRNVAKTVQNELAALIGDVSRRTAAMLASPQGHSPDAVGSLVRADADLSAERMRRASERESLHPDLVRAMVEEGMRKAGHLPHVFTRAAAQAYATADFLHTLVHGVLEKRSEIDQRVAGLSEGWALDRQPAVDRNILRIAAYEVMFLPDVPAGATINEAVELAKKYSTAESGRFVNGVLGALAAAVGKEEKSATVPRNPEGDEEGSDE